MSVRLKRLSADSQYIGRLFETHPYIRITELEGDPPEKYKIEYKLKGLAIKDGQVSVKTSHMVEVYLPLGYPRQAPQCRPLSPVFHPNIAPHAVCIGDHWSAGESLAALIARIGEMITYQSYNIKSPLNGEAARWAEQNVARLPIQKVDLSVGIEGMKPAVAPDFSAPPVAPAPEAAGADGTFKIVSADEPAPVVPASARISVENDSAFEYDAWIKAALAELQADPVGQTMGIPVSAVVSCLKSGRMEQAVKEFAPIQTTRGASNWPQIHFLTSLIQAARAKPDREIVALVNATAADPNYAVAWYHLGRAKERAGDFGAAAAAFERYLKLMPGGAAAKRHLEGVRAPKIAPPEGPAGPAKA